MSTIFNAITLSLDTMMDSWRLRNLLQLCIKNSTSSSQALNRPLVFVLGTRLFLQLDVSLDIFKIDVRKVATGKIQLMFPLKKSLG